MNKRELRELIQRTIQEALDGNKKPSLYRKSKRAPGAKPPVKKPQPAEDQELLSHLTQVLVNLETLPPLRSGPEGQPDLQQKQLAVQTANRLLQALPIPKKDLMALGKFLLGSRVFPKAPLPVILRGLVSLFRQNSTAH